MHEKFSGMQTDHLSENLCNEYSCFLVAMPKKVNDSLGSRRTGIIAPYYWYNIYDWERNKILVQCGVEGTEYRKCYAFDDSETGPCQDCFNAFMEKVKEYGYYAGKGKKAENNLLAYWTQVTEYRKNTPCTATDPDNPILALLQKPLAEFGKYVAGDFDDMPQLERECNIESNI